MFRINMDPDIIAVGGFVLSWHGLLSFLGVALAVWLVGRWAPKRGISTDAVYATAIWAIIGGIIGARLIHVIDEWRFYMANPVQILAIWNGGIGIWGAILGGFVGGAIYARLNRIPVGRLADITAPALLLAHTVGRVGCVIAGDHVPKPTTMPWGVVWAHPDTITNQYYGGQPVPAHPAVVYEMIWNMLVFALLWWVVRDRLKPEGMVFTLYLALTAIGRFFIYFYRIDREWFAGLGQAQIISLLVLAVTVPLLALRARWSPSASLPEAQVAPPRPQRGKAQA
ncbi:MAG: prolipoprotein diacylglyceryl transferase [Dehalococcoidia bacterium]|nr:prolipoprotein diacylglyceryl transferase [Dehalococcoidia bacterium]MDW8119245.1 prolipoprotein diacylglyceryl transferase [Chloroflexota bacterium]